MPKTVLEGAWLYHELGRCCLELGKFYEAASYGEQSLESATQASDDNWQINSSVLIAQAEGKNRNCTSNIFLCQTSQFTQLLSFLNLN